MSNKKILVFGGLGQLGQCLSKVTKDRNTASFVFLDEVVGDILDLDKLSLLFQKESPEFVINCAAYTAVDKAEDEPELCEKINSIGAANLARFCAEFKATLIHISTDFVFEGNVPALLKETDAASPINVYGKTKLQGEMEIAKCLEAHYILRTSWLYSEFAGNFVKTMLKLGSEREELSVIVDQVGTPTYGVDLAAVILDLVDSGQKAYGTYHYSNDGLCSWYDFAKAIFEISGAKLTVYPIPTSAYPTKARRPSFSVMDKTKIKTTFNLEIPYWRASLVKCIHAIK
ncbi:dTDP-4-dehydrorhamnose reductase [Pedobacter sp. PACM 27299]|uniref:dTDP-4-dehydrorhamnose reductase n=1 Tax=Pedobacter sp. PACM 27299 TaxID=1727164 RepID=UPI000706EC8C|nr:dTDP-4-dehydrorhamnose reductase [Pedobacter sp. PACM 27299]ALL04507.1 dTDP-4-dehydrorhamnose reductase [Pedobacter sp. PACM 27299]